VAREQQPAQHPLAIIEARHDPIPSWSASLPPWV